MATIPPVKQNARATHSATSVIGGSAVAFRSGQGRFNRPEVTAILPASHRLNVKMIKGIGGAAAGASATILSTRLSSIGSPRSAKARTVGRKLCLNAAVMASASELIPSRRTNASRATIIAIHNSRRPVGYHSIVLAGGAAPLPPDVAFGTARPNRARCPSHHAGSAMETAYTSATGTPNSSARTEAAATPPIAAASGPHPIAATISGSGARCTRISEIGTPEAREAYISAEAAPAAIAMAIVAFIGCPAPFERLEAFGPNHRRPDDPEAL